MSSGKQTVHLCQVIHGIDKALAFEWICDNLDECIHQSYILTGDQPGHLYDYLKQAGKHVEFIPFSGSKYGFPKMLLQYYRAFKRLKPDIVHAHIYPAPLLALIAAKWAGVKQRIYTRHHSTINLERYPRVAKLDRIVNNTATRIIAITENVRTVLTQMENASTDKVEIVHHGFDLKYFSDPSLDVVDNLKSKYAIGDDAYVVGVIARMIYWKGHEYIISAFKRFLESHPYAVILFANSRGPAAEEVIRTIQEELPVDSYRIITFEPDIAALYQLFDVYVHVPINKSVEAYGQTYVEALVAGVPSIFTISGVANEFVEHEKNALVVDYKNSDAILLALSRLKEDEHIRAKIVEGGKKSTIPRFSLKTYIDKLNHLYLNSN